MSELDALAERVMRGVPCPGALVGRKDEVRHGPECCGCTLTVLDPRYTALRGALFEECPCARMDKGDPYPDGWKALDGINQALDQLNLCKTCYLREQHTLDRCLCSYTPTPGFVRRSRAEALVRLVEFEYGEQWIDDLVATIVAWMDAQEVKP